MTAGYAAMLALMQRFLNGLLDPFISPIELHNLMYFMQEAGEPLRLKYQKAHYGPYAENLAIEGHMIFGYSDGGGLPDQQLTLVPGAIDEARQFLVRHEETQHRFQRVSELVEGFESSFGLELLATVHWTMKHELITSSEEVTNYIYNWNERKQQFSPRQITLAMDILKKKQWV
ncbi:Appr-1-p processing protein [Salmonella enterica subsp. salamae]|nr:Appr-1-p processing protein [Salmonella enterica subsp. salamae serovar Sofia]ECJ2536443.1 Appr-1-p processing protein [Salmonella enterica subsp. salamae serovar Sofia]EED7473232.1 Appr-1-p processing protein [Salmonella enterica subsp. salamae]